MNYTGKWTCFECGDTSDNEHDPCSCDKDESELIEEVANLRRQRDTFQQQRDSLREQLATAQHALANERQVSEGLRMELDGLRSHPFSDVIEKDTAEAIATWLLGPDAAHGFGVDLTDPNCPVGSTMTAVSKAIRAGAWRAHTEEGEESK